MMTLPFFAAAVRPRFNVFPARSSVTVTSLGTVKASASAGAVRFSVKVISPSLLISASLEFNNGVTATFNLSAFTNRIARTMKIMGEDGELRADEGTNTIEVIPFASNAVSRLEVRTIHPSLTASGHSGGDAGIVERFLAMLEHGGKAVATDISQSVESHLMACAAEESRLNGTVVEISEFRHRHEGNRPS